MRINIFSKIFNKQPQPQQPEINVGDKFIDKDWGDTELEIVQIHPYKDLLRYKFLKIDGNPIYCGSKCEMTKCFLLQKFRKL